MLIHLFHSSPAVSMRVLRKGANADRATQIPGVALVLGHHPLLKDDLTLQLAQSPITQLPWQSEASGGQPLAPGFTPRGRETEQNVPI